VIHPGDRERVVANLPEFLKRGYANWSTVSSARTEAFAGCAIEGR